MMERLFFSNYPGDCESLRLIGDVTWVGRSLKNDIQIGDRSVSRRHLKITIKNGVYYVEDLDSTNGTILDGRPIPAGVMVKVEEGTPITLGNISFSLGKPFAGKPDHSQGPIVPPNHFSNTANIVLKDRPLTNPKNLALILNVSNALMQSLDINEILQKVLSYIFDLLKRIDRGVVLLVDENEKNTLEVISKTNGTDEDTVMMYSRHIVNRVIETRQAVMMSDSMEEDESERSSSMELMQIRSVMCVPLISRSKLRGVIYVDSLNKPYGFRKEDLSLLTALSAPAALAIENALLYSNLEKIIKDRTRVLVETQRRLRDSEKRFKAIFSSSNYGIVVFNALEKEDGFVILGINKRAAKIERVEEGHVLGKRVEEAFPHFQRIGLTEVMKRVCESGKSEFCIITVERSENSTQHLECYVQLLPEKEIVLRVQDITPKISAQEDQKVLLEQLMISQKMESIGSFAGGTAHNFRNILQAISGNMEYIEMLFSDNPEMREIAHSIYGSVEKGVQLIDSLLHFSKRGGKYEMKNIDLNMVVKETYEIISQVFPSNIGVKLHLEEGLFVRGNGALLEQAIMNLLNNARDAMPKGGKLILDGKKTRNEVLITILDTGCGMNKEVMERIFDPFFSLKDVGSGTGLGLSSSLGIVEQHGGTIQVFSELGKGSRFKISLPLNNGETL